MPFWCVLIEGELPPENPHDCKGFFAARHVRARDRAAAEQAAKSMILNDWVAHYASHLRGLPTLRVDDVRRSNWWQWARCNNKGHTFYVDE
jgi:hypothetical protein